MKDCVLDNIRITSEDSMEDHIDNDLLLKKELEALPRDYTREMATRNWDVMTDLILNFNIGRLMIFMDNYCKGIPDKIRITKFGVDGPPTTSILKFDGRLITYIADDTRYPSNGFYTYHGYKISVTKRRFSYNQVIIDYNLISTNGEDFTILSIWAGFEPEPRFI